MHASDFKDNCSARRPSHKKKLIKKLIFLRGKTFASSSVIEDCEILYKAMSRRTPENNGKHVSHIKSEPHTVTGTVVWTPLRLRKYSVVRCGEQLLFTFPTYATDLTRTNSHFER